MVNYVRQNEETSCLKIVHFAGDNHKNGGKIPPELEANAKSKCIVNSQRLRPALGSIAHYISP